MNEVLNGIAPEIFMIISFLYGRIGSRFGLVNEVMTRFPGVMVSRGVATVAVKYVEDTILRSADFNG